MNNNLPVGWIATSSASNAVATATRAAPITTSVNQRHLISGYTFSFTGGVPGAATITILDGASTILDAVEIVAGSNSTPCGPIMFDYARPLACTAGNSAQATVTALGSGVSGRLFLRGRTESR